MTIDDDGWDAVWAHLAMWYWMYEPVGPPSPERYKDDESRPLDDPRAWAVPSGAGKRLAYSYGSTEDLDRSQRAARDIYD